MLGKLFQNEFKCTWKTMVTIYAVVIAATVLGCLVLGVDVFNNGKIGQVMARIFILSYVFAIAALFIVTFIFLCGRFYKTMYSDQGYLTHTIPVSSLANLNVKLITSLVWLLLSGILFLLSIGALAFVRDSETVMEFFRQMTLQGLNHICKDAFGYGFCATLGILLLLVVLGYLNLLGMVYAALSLGQLFNQHKIGAAIGFGIGIYFVQQIISSILLIRWMNLFMVRITVTYSQETEYFSNSATGAPRIIWPILLTYAVYAVIEYLITAFIVKKHINLD